MSREKSVGDRGVVIITFEIPLGKCNITCTYDWGDLNTSRVVSVDVCTRKIREM